MFVKFKSSCFIWTGEGCDQDAIPVSDGTMALILCVSEWEGPYRPHRAYVLLLFDGRIGWTPFTERELHHVDFHE